MPTKRAFSFDDWCTLIQCIDTELYTPKIAQAIQLSTEEDDIVSQTLWYTPVSVLPLYVMINGSARSKDS